ncbi:hypothetical protein AMJ49_05245 [Parcubacteria bacterium DG_74_2]|nr:MAG: hypothetical protein AMJ49_05245 [Parcubacteria bacterium DG_74_2]
MNRSIITIIAFLGALGLMVGFVWPKYGEFQRIQQDIIQKENDIQIKDVYIAELNNLSLELEEHKTELAKIDTTLPSDPSLPALFNFFQKTSAQNGLILKNINIDSALKSKEQSKIQEININLQVIGSYSSFKNFLSTLEKSARLFKIKDISFSLGGEQEGGEIEELGSSFSLSLKTHSY